MQSVSGIRQRSLSDESNWIMAVCRTTAIKGSWTMAAPYCNNEHAYMSLFFK